VVKTVGRALHIRPAVENVDQCAPDEWLATTAAGKLKKQQNEIRGSHSEGVRGPALRFPCRRGDHGISDGSPRFGPATLSGGGGASRFAWLRRSAFRGLTGVLPIVLDEPEASGCIQRRQCAGAAGKTLEKGGSRPCKTTVIRGCGSTTEGGTRSSCPPKTPRARTSAPGPASGIPRRARSSAPGNARDIMNHPVTRSQGKKYLTGDCSAKNGPETQHSMAGAHAESSSTRARN